LAADFVGLVRYGDGKDKAGIFQYTRSLQTDKVRKYLVNARGK